MSLHRRLYQAMMIAFVAIAASPASAQSWSGCSIWRPLQCLSPAPSRPPVSPTPASVPEINAAAGLLAIAAIVAIVFFVIERRRRMA